MERKVGPYTLVRRVGAGGMGEVHQALDPQGGRVALKLLLGPPSDVDLLARFRREAEVSRHVSHPALARVLDAGEERGRPWLAMEWIEGESLQDRSRAAPLTPEELARIGLALAGALHALHRAELVHRDVKPQNVLVNREGRVWLVDLGLVSAAPGAEHLTRTGDVLGSPGTMAPEQAAGERSRIGPASDVYGLGATLYQAWTGRPPFQGASPLDTLRAVLEDPLVPPSALRAGLPPGLEAILLRCLERDPARRFPSAAALGRALEAWREGPTSVETSSGAAARGAAASLLLLGLGALLLAVWRGPGSNASPPAPTAAAPQATPGPELPAASPAPDASSPADAPSYTLSPPQRASSQAVWEALSGELTAEVLEARLAASLLLDEEAKVAARLIYQTHLLPPEERLGVLATALGQRPGTLFDYLVRYRLACYLHQAGDGLGAWELLRPWREEASLQCLLGQWARGLGLQEQAVRHLRAALADGDISWQTRFNLAGALMQAGGGAPQEEGLELYRALHREGQTPFAGLRLAEWQLASGGLDEAERVLVELSTRWGAPADLPEWRSHWARLSLLRGDPGQAVLVAQESLRWAGQDLWWRDTPTLVAALRALGRAEEAEAFLAQVRAEHAGEPDRLVGVDRELARLAAR